MAHLRDRSLKVLIATCCIVRTRPPFCQWDLMASSMVSRHFSLFNPFFLFWQINFFNLYFSPLNIGCHKSFYTDANQLIACERIILVVILVLPMAGKFELWFRQEIYFFLKLFSFSVNFSSFVSNVYVWVYVLPRKFSLLFLTISERWKGSRSTRTTKVVIDLFPLVENFFFPLEIFRYIYYYWCVVHEERSGLFWNPMPDSTIHHCHHEMSIYTDAHM